MGVGGVVRLSDRLHLDAEISDGDLGQGGKLGQVVTVSLRL